MVKVKIKMKRDHLCTDMRPDGSSDRPMFRRAGEEHMVGEALAHALVKQLDYAELVCEKEEPAEPPKVEEPPKAERKKPGPKPQNKALDGAPENK